jgi:diguanylate cyclase (GGDEF)-like protein
MACRTSLIVVFLFLLYHQVGMLGLAPLRNVLIAMAAAELVFFALLRSGVNQRFADPSLTLWMILAFTAVMLYVIWKANGEKSLLVLVYLIPYLFGLFRLSSRYMLVAAAAFLAGYAVILWDLADRLNPAMLVLRWTVPAVVLIWFAVFAGYVAQLRKRLAQSNRQLSAALEHVQSVMAHDDLTGVYNRRRMNELLALEQTRCERGGEPFSVFIMDLDHFKDVNDTFGHAAGDAVLKGFADSMRQILRPSDFFGRVGGEEFLLVSTQTSMEGAIILAERIRAHCEATRYACLPEGWTVTLSVGLSQFRPGEDTEASLHRADAALYAAKQGGRNRVEVN